MLRYLALLFVHILSSGALFSQHDWVPEDVQARFHSGPGQPWFMKDGRPDSLDILHYHIALSRFDRKNGTFRGECRIRFRPLVEGMEGLRLDLAGFGVNAVKRDGKELSFDREGEHLFVHFPRPLEKGDSVEIDILYSGHPVIDKTGWGGLYFREGMVFNLGVGFGAKPHSYGRSWFPCVDHFRERASYSFQVKTRKEEKAVCSGVLREKVEVEGGYEWHWELKEELPPYLVSFAVGELVTLRDEFRSISGRKVPVRLDVPPEDSSKALLSFSRLEEAFAHYEECFGPYRWPRVGYVAVPFPSGAMEHATNIAYPQAAVNGTHSSEDLMVHELAHSWWGNLLTCATPWDMWINEGMASFSEFLFREKLDGPSAYKEAVRETHRKVLRSAHINDDGRRAVYGIPHGHTYGTHVYDKGADVVRTLRYLLGDSLFFPALRRTLEEHPFQNMPTHRLGELWQEYTERPVERYFEDWLLKPGFPHFSVTIRSVEEVVEGGYQVDLRVEQRMTDAETPYKFVPLELLFLGPEGERWVDSLMLNEEEQEAGFELPFRPVHVSVDPGGWIAQASIVDTATLSMEGVHSFDHVGATLDIDSLDGPAYVELRQHFIEPDLRKGELSKQEVSRARYWSVHGTFPEASSNATVLSFDGQQRKGVHPEAAFFADMEEIDESELYVLRRAPNEESWGPCSTCRVLSSGSSSDGKGKLLIEGGKKGDFALAREAP